MKLLLTMMQLSLLRSPSKDQLWGRGSLQVEIKAEDALVVPVQAEDDVVE